MDIKAAIKITAATQGEQAVDRLRLSMGRLDGAAGVLRTTLASLGGVAVAYKFASLIKGSIDAADNLNDLSQRTGMAVEDLDALSLVAAQNGTDLEKVSGGLAKLAKLMGEAAGGSEKARAVLAQFGVTAKDTYTDALAKLSDKIAAMPDGWQKAAAAQAVFGKSAADMVPFLNAGGAAISGAREQLEHYGVIVTGPLAQAADQFNDKLALLEKIATGAAGRLAEQMLPALSDVAQALLDFAGNEQIVGRASAAMGGFFEEMAATIRSTQTDIENLISVYEYLQNLPTNIGNSIDEFAYGTLRGKNSLPAGTLNRSLGQSDFRATPDDLKAQLDSVDRFVSGMGPKKQRQPFNFDFEAVGSSADKAAAAAKRHASAVEQQEKQIRSYILAQQGANELLALEAQKVNMSAHEYDMLVEAKRHEIEVRQATADMLPEQAAKYKLVSDQIFKERQAIEDLNYEQSRTFGFGAKQAFQEYIDQATNAADQAHDLFSHSFQGMEDALVEFVQTGKLDFSSLVDSILSDLARMAVRQAILAPLFGAMGGGSGGGVFGSLIGSLFSGSSAAASGALVGASSASKSLSQGGNTQVVINNAAGVPATATESSDGRGNRRVEVTIGDMVAGEVRRSGSPMHQAIRQSFPVAPAVVGR